MTYWTMGAVAMIAIGGVALVWERVTHQTAIREPAVTTTLAWPKVAPDGKTAIAATYIWTKLADEDNKWVMLTRGEDGEIVWLYARLTTVEIPARTDEIFSEMQEHPWPKQAR